MDSEHLPFTDRTARNYMKLHEHRERLKTETVSDLNEAYDLLRRPQLPDAAESLGDSEAVEAQSCQTGCRAMAR